MIMQYTEEELKQDHIECKRCGSASWIIIGEGKFDRDAHCRSCGAERMLTMSEFYPPGRFVD